MIININGHWNILHKRNHTQLPHESLNNNKKIPLFVSEFGIARITHFVKPFWIFNGHVLKQNSKILHCNVYILISSTTNKASITNPISGNYFKSEYMYLKHELMGWIQIVILQHKEHRFYCILLSASSPIQFMESCFLGQRTHMD